MNRYFIDESIISPGGIPLDYHSLPPIKPNFGVNHDGLAVSETTYEEYCEALAELQGKLRVVTEE